MSIQISDALGPSLDRLTADEQRSAKATLSDILLHPENPGLSLHKLDRARDKNFWSVRVSSDIRMIVHKTDANLLICYVDHHDKAYAWAERRKIERHPTTGSVQIVEIRELVREITVPRYVEGAAEPAAPATTSPATEPVFAGYTDGFLMSYGVPEEWLADVKAADEDQLLELVDHLPDEAAEALVQMAAGETPARPTVVGANEDPFEHPDAKRRFRVVDNIEEITQALEYPWEKWIVFLHPAQRAMVERSFAGPARVSGSAGTGKTIVALHRAVHLAKTYPRDRVLLTTFSRPLASNLRRKLHRLVDASSDVAQRITVRAIDEVGQDFYAESFGTPGLATESKLQVILSRAAASVPDHNFTIRFLMTEWREVVDAWQLDSWEAYRDVQRLGRKMRLGEKQRRILWDIFDAASSNLRDAGLVTMPMIYLACCERLLEGESPPAERIVVDEAQDIGVAQLRFLAAATGEHADGLFFAGDLGQRIFQTPFSWKSLGVDVRGRSSTLHINYRTSHQIRRQADHLLDPEIADVDGVVESRRGTVSVFNGSEPMVNVSHANEQDEIAFVGDHWLKDRLAEGIEPDEIGLIVRSNAEVSRAQRAAERAGVRSLVLDHETEPTPGRISICTMHFAKGLEFRAVAVMACDEDVIPLLSRIESIVDDSDLEEVTNTERHLLYVACTRARDHLLLSGIAPGSEYIDDLAGTTRNT